MSQGNTTNVWQPESEPRSPELHWNRHASSVFPSLSPCFHHCFLPQRTKIPSSPRWVSDSLQSQSHFSAGFPRAGHLDCPAQTTPDPCVPFREDTAASPLPTSRSAWAEPAICQGCCLHHLTPQRFPGVQASVLQEAQPALPAHPCQYPTASATLRACPMPMLSGP